MHPRQRDVVRALIVSPESRLLLVRIKLSDCAFWITPGGGRQAGEDHYDALRRELNEEIGRTHWNIGKAVWTRSHTFDFEGETLTQHETFHWVASEEFDPPAEMPDQHENQYFDGFRWWSTAQLLASTQDFAPRKIAIYFDQLLTTGLPETPTDVGI